MTTRRLNCFRWCTFSALAAALAAALLNDPALGQSGQPETPEGVEVQTRGPVHEAFAGVVSFRPEPGVVVAKAPPDPIEELPPDQKPAGANVTWIPGYWAWDDDREDFLWVSGVWRSLPPGRQWVPGYWNRTDAGYQWISGYWADAQTDQVEYLPEPPASIDEGPSVEPQSPDQVWMPGTWVWYHGRFAWRPGYWATARSNWVWVPASYVWSPRGYIFVDGYWDYTVGRRGVLFAPVYIDAGVYGQRGFLFSPAFAISMSVFADSLFLRPAAGHYYFGDYYAASYASAGFYPWFSFQNQYRNGYDPIFASQQWQNRQNSGWEQNLESQFEKRRENEDARPPHTLAAQGAGGKPGAKAVAAGLVAVPLAQLAKDQSSGLRLQPVSKTERQELGQSAKKIHDYRGERQKLDAHVPATTAGKPAAQSEPARGKLPRSPVAARSAGNLDAHEAPPEPHKAPQPDPSVQPGPSKPGSRPPPAGEPRPKAEPRPASPKPQPPAAEPKAKKPDPRPAPPKPQPPAAEPKPKKPEPRPEPPKGPPPKPEAPKAGPPAPGHPPAKSPPQPPAPPPNKKPGPPPPKPEPPKP